MILHQLQFLYLTTNGRKTARQYTIEIWFIEYNTRYYIISEHKKIFRLGQEYHI